MASSKLAFQKRTGGKPPVLRVAGLKLSLSRDRRSPNRLCHFRGGGSVVSNAWSLQILKDVSILCRLLTVPHCLPMRQEPHSASAHVCFPTMCRIPHQIKKKITRPIFRLPTLDIFGNFINDYAHLTCKMQSAYTNNKKMYHFNVAERHAKSQKLQIRKS